MSARPDVLLCDADGNLFPTEEIAFEASTLVTNQFLRDYGISERFGADELRRRAAGRNFRATATALAEAAGVTPDPADLEARVAEEREAVVARLRTALAPDERVRAPLERLATRFTLAIVSSSALERLEACVQATGLADLFPPELRFSAEDSLPVPTSKPDPAVYALAGERLGVRGAQALAVEDAMPGVLSAVGAGFPVVVNLLFVGADERAARERDAAAAGAEAVVASWEELEARLG